ncbi:MAG: virion core protein [Bacteroidota bacterium]|jgi:membrane protease subunit (stomatin/prohibitin family)|nr:virion core protein [Bacteroidota bacterium]
MGLWDKIKGEFIDIIDWTDSSNDTIIYKFPRFQNEIKMGAKLTVRESQIAVFMNEGQIADVFQPGMYTLSTQNMPILSTLKGWKFGFNSPFKADVFFVSTRQFTNQKWGTKNPIMLRDAEFGPIRLRAFGSYAFKISDAALFLKEISGTDSEFKIDEVNEQLRNIAVSRGMDALAESRIPVLDLSANTDEVSKIITDKIKPEFSEIGLNLTKFLIENISLPPEVEEALDKRSSMGIIGNLGAYTQFQAANAMQDAANNPAGGMMGAGLGAGMGMGMMGQMGNAFQNQQFNGNTGTNVPPPPPVTQFFVAVNGAQTGPFTIQQLQAMAVSGQFNKHSLVWKQGMAGWLAAETQAELAQIFNAVPPPPPLG